MTKFERGKLISFKIGEGGISYSPSRVFYTLTLKGGNYFSTQKGPRGVQPSMDYFQEKSWKNFFIIQYNKLPPELKNISPGIFKDKRLLKGWIWDTVPSKPP